MKFENFELQEPTSLILKADGMDTILDLAEDYDFAGFDYDAPARRVTCRWNPASGSQTVRLAFDSVIALWAEPRDPDMQAEDDLRLVNMGMGEALDDDDQPVLDQEPVFYMSFESEFALYIIAGTVRLDTGR